jgi:thiol-disulfide isomerase/thioredoxin
MIERGSPQELVAAGIQQAREHMRTGSQIDALSALEGALEIAHANPYDIEFETRTRLAVDLADLYVHTNQLAEARDLMRGEAKFAEEVYGMMQQIGTPDQKRTASKGWVAVRDRAAHVALIGEPAPEISVDAWVQGGPLNLAGLRGQVILLEFWATWCQPCVQAFAKLGAMDDERRASGLSIVALTRYYSSAPADAAARQEEQTMVRKFLEGREVIFPVGIADGEETHRLYGATGLPTMTLIDRSGRVRSTHFGTESPRLHRELDELLGASGTQRGN